MSSNPFARRRWLTFGLLSVVFSALIAAESNKGVESDQSSAFSTPSVEPHEPAKSVADVPVATTTGKASPQVLADRVVSFPVDI